MTELAITLPFKMLPVAEGDTQPENIEVSDISCLCVRFAGVGETGIGKPIETSGVTRYELSGSSITVHVAPIADKGEAAIIIDGKYGQVNLHAKIVLNVGAGTETISTVSPYVFMAIATDSDTVALREKVDKLDKIVNGGKSDVDIPLDITLWFDSATVYWENGKTVQSSTTDLAAVNVEDYQGKEIIYRRRKLNQSSYPISGLAFYNNDITQSITSAGYISGQVSEINGEGTNDYIEQVILVPENAMYAAIPWYSNSKESFKVFSRTQITEGGLVNDVIELKDGKQDKLPIKVNCIKVKADSLGSSPISVTIPNTFKRGVVGFSANINNDFTGRIKIYSAGAFNVGRVELDSTNIYYYNVLNGGTPVRTIAHGLTIGTFVSVLIKTGVVSGYRCSVLVSTQSGQFEDDDANGYWNAASAPISVEMVSGECTNAELSFSIMYKNVLLCGDSYMDYLIRNISNQETAPQLIIDGYPGRTSNGGYNSLITTISMITPKVLIWALGMNDQDNAQSYNASWKENLDKVIALCNKQGVELVLATIPSAKDDSGNFGNHNNEKKNDWIRNSGYRYIDIARAVGAKSDGTWAEGLKGSDVHPSNAGAKVIWGAYLASVPEING